MGAIYSSETSVHLLFIKLLITWLSWVLSEFFSLLFTRLRIVYIFCVLLWVCKNQCVVNKLRFSASRLYRTRKIVVLTPPLLWVCLHSAVSCCFSWPMPRLSGGTNSLWSETYLINKYIKSLSLFRDGAPPIWQDYLVHQIEVVTKGLEMSSSVTAKRYAAFGCRQKNCPWVGFEVLTAVVLRGSVFWNISACSLFRVNRRFEGTYRL
jgi:hypothetical protein